MTDKAGVDVEIEHPHQHHHPTGHHWLDKVLPISALFVSLISIWIAYHHGEVMQELVNQNERLVQANSLPHLQLYGSNFDPEGGNRVSFIVSNAGVGPAEIRSVQVAVDGKPVQSFREMMQACCGTARPHGATTSSLLGLMIRPGQDVRYIDSPIQAADQSNRLEESRRAGRIVTTVCYCSVFGDCWIRSSNNDERPKPVAACPMPEPQYRE